MISIRRAAALAACLGLAAAAPAGASTTLGSLPSDSTSETTCSSAIAWQNQATDATVTAPANGVITSVRTLQAATQAGNHFKVEVVSLDNRSFSPSAQITVHAKTDALTIAGSGAVESFATRLPIAAGQGIAMSTTEGFDCTFSTASSSDQVLFNSTGGDPAVGTLFHPDDGGANIRVPLEAVVEPDADGDGFGDETQDQCPSDASIQGPCQADVGISGSVTPTTVSLGDVAVLTGAVANTGPGKAPGAAVHVTPSAGLQVLSQIPTTGCTFTTLLTCSLGDLLKDGSTPIAVVVKATKVGAQSLAATVDSTVADPNSANNALSAPIAVTAQQVPVVCAVPSLKGLTKAFARKLLAVVHCRLGKVTRKKSARGARGTVIKQSRKAGAKLAPGSKVNVTLRK